MKKIFVVLIISIQSGYLSGQDKDAHFDLWGYVMDTMKFEFTCPPKYIETDTSEFFMPADGLVLGNTFYRIESPKNDLVIMFNVMPVLTKKDSADLAKFVPPPPRNNQYLYAIRAHQDTTAFRTVFFSVEYAHREFNADHAGIYQLRQTVKYHDKYAKCKVVYLQKNERGIVELYYFYNEPTNVDKYIKQTAKRVRFKE